MKKHFSPLLILAATLIMIMTSPAIAEVRGGAFTLSPFVGGYTFDGVQHRETNVAMGLGLGYNITGNWGLEGRFTWVPLQTTEGNIPGEYSLFNFHGDVLYHFMPEGRFVPYVALGGGLSRTEWPGYDNSDAILVYGGGVKYFLNDRLALRGDIRQIFSFHPDGFGGTDYWNNFEYTFGLAFQFGGTKPGAPAVKAKPQEAPAPALPAQAEIPAPPPAAAEPPTPARAHKPAPPPEPATATEAAPPPKPAPAPEAAPLPEPPPTPAPTAVEQTSWLAKEGAKVPEGKIMLTGMTIRPDALEVVFTKSFYYEIHVLSKPSRLEIDIHDAVNGLAVDKAAVNKIGIATVRLENRPDFLRFVLYPAVGYSLPSRVDVMNDFRGLLIHMASPLKKK
jgi:outer membrane beta-barrel protein